MGNVKTCQYLNKAVVATFWATFGKNWATFYNQHLATLLLFLPLVVVLVVVRSCCVQKALSRICSVVLFSFHFFSQTIPNLSKRASSVQFEVAKQPKNTLARFFDLRYRKNLFLE